MTKLLASAISLALTSPFVVLEIFNNGLRADRALDYVVLFGLLWVLPIAFLLTAMPPGRLLSPVMRIAILVVVAVAWVGVVSDQLPCFMGSANCD